MMKVKILKSFGCLIEQRPESFLEGEVKEFSNQLVQDWLRYDLVRETDEPLTSE